MTAEVPLILYTLLIFVRNMVAGFDTVPRDVLEAADGMGFPRNRRLRRIELPLAIPLIVVGVRLATRLDDRPGHHHGHPRRPIRRTRVLHLRGLSPHASRPRS